VTRHCPRADLLANVSWAHQHLVTRRVPLTAWLSARPGMRTSTRLSSPHWLRHAHDSHAIDPGATLPEAQPTLGHANVSTTSGYLHARPDTSSGLRLDPGVFLR
jgi:site-specific recombinase XerD